MRGGAVRICAIGVCLSDFLLVCACVKMVLDILNAKMWNNVEFCARLCRRRAAFGAM